MFDVLAGVFVDDILDVVDVGIFVAPVVVSGGGVTVKQDTVVCIVFVVALTDVVKDGLLVIATITLENVTNLWLNPIGW